MYNFPKVEDIYRSYLKSEIELTRLKNECEGKLKDFNELRQLSETSIGNLSFEDLFLPYDYFESKENYNNLNTTSVDDILEKYIILKYLISNSPFNYLENGVNYFDSTIFGGIIQSKYKSIKELKKKFEEIEKPYIKIFNDFHNAEIQKLLNFPKKKETSSNLIRFIKQIQYLK